MLLHSEAVQARSALLQQTVGLAAGGWCRCPRCHTEQAVQLQQRAFCGSCCAGIGFPGCRGALSGSIEGLVSRKEQVPQAVRIAVGRHLQRSPGVHTGRRRAGLRA